MIFPNTYTIKLDHTKNQIDGFWFGLNSVFWWFGEKSTIVYHYKDYGSRTYTKYIELHKDINRNTHQIIGYVDDTSTLILKEI